jgi:hypothetical protein
MAAVHHQNAVLHGGLWTIARPLRDTNPWHRWRQERRCGKEVGHCWHPDYEDWIGWWCCMCSKETEGMPPQRCRHCTGGES